MGRDSSELIRQWVEMAVGQHTKEVIILQNNMVDLIMHHTAPKQSGNGFPTNYRPLSDEDVRKGWVDLSTWHQDGQEFTKDGCPVARVQPSPASVP